MIFRGMYPNTTRNQFLDADQLADHTSMERLMKIDHKKIVIRFSHKIQKRNVIHANSTEDLKTHVRLPYTSCFGP